MTAFNSTPLSVSELNRQARMLLERTFLTVTVSGEISSLSIPASGHWYFTLKDSQAQVRCAMFRNQARSVGKPPAQGESVIIRAKVSLYENRGDYQLICESMQRTGDGALQLAFEQLKNELKTLGLFDQIYKKALPSHPKAVGIVTSPTGAAIRDILTVLARRYPALPVYIYPCVVQGSDGANSISSAIQLANQDKRCDLLIVARGGGSLEDLWCFNDRKVADAIFQSQLPVVSAVGHETDFLISDFVADLRAATPSAAAELVSPDREQLALQLRQLEKRLLDLISRGIEQQQRQLNHLSSRLRHPGDQLKQRQQRVDELSIRLQKAQQRLLAQKALKLETTQQRLTRSNPLYLIKALREKTVQHERQLQQQIHQQIRNKQQQFYFFTEQLQLLSPLSTLKRGYSISRMGQRVIQSAAECQVGDEITITLAKGSLNAQVTHSEPENP